MFSAMRVGVLRPMLTCPAALTHFHELYYACVCCTGLHDEPLSHVGRSGGGSQIDHMFLLIGLFVLPGKMYPKEQQCNDAKLA